MSAIDSPPPPPAPRRRFRRALAIALAAVLAIAALLAALGWWIVATPGGAQLVVAKVANLLGHGAKIEGVEGRLGGALRIRRIEIDRPDLYVRIDDLVLDTSPLDPLRGWLVVHRLHAGSIEVRTASSAGAARLPVSFTPPYPVRLEDGRIDTLRYGAITAAERDAKDPRSKQAARDAARAKDVVLHDIVLRGEGDRTRWTIGEAAVRTEYGAARVSGTLGNTTPFALELSGSFDGALQERALRATAKLHGTLASFEADVDAELAGTRASARAVLTPFSSTPVKSVTVSAPNVDLARLAAGLPATRLALEANLAPEGHGFAGPVRIVNADPGPWDQRKLPFGSATARVAATTERLDVTGLGLALLGGGSVEGEGAVEKGSVHARLRVAGVDLAALQRGLQETKLSGTVAIKARKDTQRFEVALEDPRFRIDGSAVLARERLDIEAMRVRTGAGTVVASGGASLAGKKEFRFQGRGEHFDPSAFVKTAAGDLTFTFAVSGTLAPNVAGEFRADLAPSRFAGLPAAGHIALAGDRHRIERCDVHVTLGETRLDATGRFGRTGDALQLALHSPNVSALAGPFGVALAGRLDAQARLTGTFESPAGSLSLDGSNLALPSNVHVRELALRLQAGSERSSPIDASLRAQGVALGKQTPPTPFARSLEATLKGTRSAHRLDIAVDLTAESKLHAVLRGGVDERARDLAWLGQVESLAFNGNGAFALAAPATLTASAQSVELGDATLRGDWGEAHLVRTRWTPQALEVRGSTPGLEIQNLARSLRLGKLPRSNLVIAADWDIRAAQAFEGSLDLHCVSGDLRVGDPALPLGLRALAVNVVAQQGRVRAVVRIDGEHVGRIEGEGSAAIERGGNGWQLARSAPVSAEVSAQVPDLAPFAAWLGPDGKAGGRLEARFSVSGTGGDPRVSGTARAQDLTLREPQTGFELERGEVALRMDGHTIALERLTASTPWRVPKGAHERLGAAADGDAGSLEAEGSIDLSARSGAIRIRATRVPVMQLPTRFVALSGEARLEAGEKGMVATGSLAADAGWIGALAAAPPSPSDDVIVVRASQPAEPAAKPREPIRLDVRFALGDHMYFQGRGLDTRLSGDVHVTGEAAAGALRASGAIRTEGGTYDGYGQKLAIERGVLQFAGPIDNPLLNVRAMRTGLAVEAGVEVTGSTSRPRVRLVSSPEVPEPEKLSWLVLGRGPSDLAPGDVSVLVSAAASMLGKGDPGSDIGRKLGFDEVGIGRSGNNSVLGVLPQSTVAGRTGPHRPRKW